MRIKAVAPRPREDRRKGGCKMRLFKTLMIAAALALPVPASAQDATAGAVLYADFCAVCHGASAAGDGPMAEVLTIAPPDLTALAAGGAFPVLRVARQIDGRRPLQAHGGPMPIFGPWFEGDGADVVLQTEAGQPVMMSRPIADLIAYLIEIQS
jgi:mono/diheme cytochrome c family protein